MLSVFAARGEDKVQKISMKRYGAEWKMAGPKREGVNYLGDFREFPSILPSFSVMRLRCKDRAEARLRVGMQAFIATTVPACG